MALVGEARIKVVADTKHVREEIQKAFAGMDKDASTAGNSVSKSFNKGMSSGMGNGKGFSKFKKEAEEMSSQFHKAIRSSYKWQAASGALLQSVMALGGGLLALAGNIAGAASSGIALVGMMAQIKVASMVAKSAFKGVMAAVKADSSGAKGATKTIKELREEMQQLAFAAEKAALSEEAASIKLEKAREDLARVSNLPPDNRARREAQLAYSEAELAYRMAKDKNDDAQDEILNPKKKKTGGAATDPYKDLTKTQREFAIGLKEVMPRFKELNEAAASKFLPELGKQLKNLFSSGMFKTLVKGFESVSAGLGKATKSFAGTMFDPGNQKNLSTFFKNAGTTTGTFGAILGNAFSGFITLMNAINPLVTRFTSFLQTKSIGFAANMKKDFANVQGFFKNAGDAAAGWGAILGRLFEKFKGMIKANVGPGTGGQLLLDFFNQGTTGFRNLDGAAGEFARKQHFLASATNLKAMLESLGKIFSFMSDLGTDPAVAQFWNILAELEGPLSDIFDSIQGSSDELARLLVTIVEIIASFADAAQLETYMKVLGDIFAILGGIVKMLQPILQFFGPLVGALGALVTTFYLLKKVTMIVTGTTLIFNKVTAFATFLTNARRLATVGSTRDMALMARVQAGLNALMTKEGRIQMFNTLKLAFSSVAKGANTAATTAMTGATVGATVATTGFGAAVNLAIWPLTLIVAAIALVVVGIIALVGWMNAVKADNIKKAGKEIDKSFTSTRGKALDAADAQSQWTSALKVHGGQASSSIASVKDMGKALNETAKVAYTSTGSIKYHSKAYYEAKEAMNVYVGSLAKLAKKNLPEAQRQFRNMIVSSGMSRKATEEAILANKDMVKSLEKQAKAMGDTIMNADGTVNAMKAVDYAIGEGSFVRQQAVLEQKKFAETFKNAALTFIDSNDAVQKATKNGKFSIDAYVKDMKNQSKALLNWRKNLSTLNTLFTDKGMLQDIIAMGSAGSNLVETLAEGGAAAVKKYTDSQNQIKAAKDEADAYVKAYSNMDAVIAAVTKKFGSGSMTNMARTMEAEGKSVMEIVAALGISEKELMTAQKGLKSQDLAQNVNISAAWNKESLKTAKKELDKELGVQTWSITANKPTTYDPTNGGTKNPVSPKDGGYIKRAMGGLVARFADGWGPSYNGRVTGPGTGRSDSIPAMISNGEFVVNARATAQNMDLLNAINSNKNVSGKAGNQIAITVNAAPGMDEQQVAAQVARQLDAQLSRGGSM